jgi:hypothetical protein
MTNPTSNFGWQMPESTDLVTNLPADFEVFGQAVDTDFVDLLGGSTGQILSKTSGTDLDFTWINAAGGGAALTQIVPTSTTVSGGTGSIGASGAVTFTGCTSASVNGAFTSTYTNYLIITDSISANTQTDIYFRLRASGSNATSNYNIMWWTKPYATGAASVTSLGNTAMGTTQWYFGDGNTSEKYSNSISLFAPQLAQGTGLDGYFNSVGTFSKLGGQQTDSTQFDGFTFYTTTNNISCVVRVYGYSK